jgi:hypothetical protein
VTLNNTPDIDAPCGLFLTFRHLIECGETQAVTGISNLPSQHESYNALYDLATYILDPVIGQLGTINLTFGFCSPKLARKIPGRIAPKLDQHAAHEVNTRNNIICPRLGAAADFLIKDKSMLDVAKWVVKNTQFDRLYYYGEDRPIHVSFGPNHDRQIVLLLPRNTGRVVPKVINKSGFLLLK